MSMMYKFDKEFVERTKEILNNCYNNSEYEVTLLLNCLLALVSLPIEKTKYNNSSKANHFKKICIIKLKELKNSKDNDIYDENDYRMFNHIRNALAHLYIELEERKLQR